MTRRHAEASRSGKRLADGLFNRRGDGIEAAMEKIKMKYAIFNSVDTIPRFPRKGVYLFSTRKEAIAWAVKKIRKYCPEDFSDCKTDSKLLTEFQSTLGFSEWFHVVNVKAAK